MVPEGSFQPLINGVCRSQGVEGAGDIVRRQAVFQYGRQILVPALDEPFGLDGFRIDLAVDEVRPAEEEGVGEEHLQIGQGLGPDMPALFLFGQVDLGQQGFEGGQVIVFRVEPVIGDEAQRVEKGDGVGEDQAVVGPSGAEIPGPIKFRQNVRAADPVALAICGPPGSGRPDPLQRTPRADSTGGGGGGVLQDAARTETTRTATGKRRGFIVVDLFAKTGMLHSTLCGGEFPFDGRGGELGLRRCRVWSAGLRA